MHENSVRGRLKGCLAFWKEELDAPPWILDTIENGYVLPFYNEPESYTRPNQKSALVERDFVNGAVADLLAGGYIEVAREVPHVQSAIGDNQSVGGKEAGSESETRKQVAVEAEVQASMRTCRW